jgi:hypothetical protein
MLGPGSPTSATAAFREVLLPRHPSGEWAVQITWPGNFGVRVSFDTDPARFGVLIEDLCHGCSR